MEYQQSKASLAEISGALQVLFDALPFQRGAGSDNATAAYVEALNGMTLDGIHAGVRKFLRGECSDVSPRFVPTPPELARIVRGAVVPSRIPEERRIAPYRPSTAGERDRMRLKMPLYRHAMDIGAMDELDAANRRGLGAMIALAGKWGIPVPDALLDAVDGNGEAEWQTARRRAWAEIERDPPPFMLHDFSGWEEREATGETLE